MRQSYLLRRHHLHQQLSFQHCKESNLNYIKNNIINSQLSILFNLNNVDWNHIDALSKNKNFYKDICDYYNKTNKFLTEISRDLNLGMSNLAYELAGIRQSNVFKMMIASYGEYIDMAEKANNADGMTLTNQEKYAESLKGKITELGTIWEKIGDDAVSSSFLKGLTDVGIGVSSLVEKFGLLKTAIVGIGAYAGIKNAGECA